MCSPVLSSPAAPKALPPEMTGLPGATGGGFSPPEGSRQRAYQGMALFEVLVGVEKPKVLGELAWRLRPCEAPVEGLLKGVSLIGHVRN